MINLQNLALLVFCIFFWQIKLFPHWLLRVVVNQNLNLYYTHRKCSDQFLLRATRWQEKFHQGAFTNAQLRPLTGRRTRGHFSGSRSRKCQGGAKLPDKKSQWTGKGFTAFRAQRSTSQMAWNPKFCAQDRHIYFFLPDFLVHIVLQTLLWKYHLFTYKVWLVFLV